MWCGCQAGLLERVLQQPGPPQSARITVGGPAPCVGPVRQSGDGVAMGLVAVHSLRGVGLGPTPAAPIRCVAVGSAPARRGHRRMAPAPRACSKSLAVAEGLVVSTVAGQHRGVGRPRGARSAGAPWHIMGPHPFRARRCRLVARAAGRLGRQHTRGPSWHARSPRGARAAMARGATGDA